MAPPELSGFATLLVDRRDGSPLEVVRLPQGLDALAVRLTARPDADVHAELILYRATPEALELPAEPATVERAGAGELGAETFAAPDRTLWLGADLTWRDAPDETRVPLRLRPRACLPLTVDAVTLPVSGGPRFVVPWGEDEALVAGPTQPDGRSQMFVVSRTGARRVAMPELHDGWRATLDDEGRAWFARPTRRTDTGTAAATSAVIVERLDRALTRVEWRARVEVGLPQELDPWRVAVRTRADGPAELALLVTTKGDELPRVLTWRDGERTARRLPWPRPEDALPNPRCEGVGVYRTHLWLGEVGELEFVLGEGNLTRWRADRVERERIDAAACGVSFLDGLSIRGWAVIDPIIPPLPDGPDPRRVYRRRGADWVFVGDAPTLNGLGMTSWRDRVWGAGADGRVYELDQRRDGPLRVCPPIIVDELSDRIEWLVPRGDAMLGVGPHRDGYPWRVYWLKAR